MIRLEMKQRDMCAHGDHVTTRLIQNKGLQASPALEVSANLGLIAFGVIQGLRQVFGIHAIGMVALASALKKEGGVGEGASCLSQR